MENNLVVGKEKNIENNLEKEQSNFLDSMLGKAVNTALDIGIRAILPNFVEDQIINIKDNLFEYGLKDGISKTIQDAVELGKSAVGIVTGDFENVTQMQNAVKEGGIIDGMSTLIDFTLKQVKKTGLLNSNIVNLISNGKDVILNNLENNIEKGFKKQISMETDIEKYIENWKKEYNNKNLKGMEKEYKKIEKEIKKLAPIEEKIKEARKIENIQNLIKNKGNDFNISETEMELLEKF